MSFTAVILPILAALSTAQEKISPTHHWLARNEEQTHFLQHYYSQREELSRLTPEELRSFASSDVREVNRFLRDNGFTIQLNEAYSRDALAVASILNIALKWKVPGQKTTLTVEKVSYPAVRMTAGFTLRRLDDGQYIVAIDAENGDTVSMMRADVPLQGAELIHRLQPLSSQKYHEVTHEFSGLRFPTVSINQEVDISWLAGMRCADYSIAQALQQTRFQMDEKGAAVQSAVAIVCVKSCMPRPTFDIVEPFYLWIERPGMSLPLFAAYVDCQDWKELALLPQTDK